MRAQKVERERAKSVGGPACATDSARRQRMLNGSSRVLAMKYESSVQMGWADLGGEVRYPDRRDR